MCRPDANEDFQQRNRKGSTLQELLRGIGVIAVIHNLSFQETKIPRNFSIYFWNPDSKDLTCTILAARSKEMAEELREARVQIQ